ncbi:MAG: hypothetical protein AB7I35_08635 [Ramlibacter sp.]
MGNFQPGISSVSTVIGQGRSVVVVAGGQAFVIDPWSRRLVGMFGGDIQSAHLVEEGLLTSNGIEFELNVGVARQWRSKRVSWDGMRNIQIHSGIVTGEGWCFDDSWHVFYIHLSDGSSHGGAYHGPES